MNLISPYCVFHRLTGLYCPGCGGTRAFFYLLHGHPLMSLWYHPIVIYALFALVYYGLFFLRRKPGKNGAGRTVARAFPSWPLWGALIILITNFVLKNVILMAAGIDPLP